MDNTNILATELGITVNHAQNIINLIDEGCTIPFIARYRKEMTGSCDDQTLRLFADRLNYLRNLDKRKEEVTKLIADQEKLTDEIKAKIDNANTLTELEDIYRPFRPKRETRATKAIAKGLKPLADIILAQKLKEGNPLDVAKEYVNNDEDEKKRVSTPEEALQGALDIIAETISDDAEVRKELRKFMQNTAQIETTLKEAENFKTYEMYDGRKEAIKTIPSHRILAINRGEKEKCLKVQITANQERCVAIISKEYLKNNGNIFEECMKTTILDSFERLIMPSLDTELRNELTDRANEQAIKMFKVNLKPLLMQPPLKHKTILGFDPGYRTGCKLAVIDENGKVLDKGVVFATPPQNKIEESEKIILNLIDKYKIDCISIGNGTASKESEIFIANLIKKAKRPVSYMVVSEAGASVYSASKLAAEEFPEFDVTTRSAVSIARRMQDPLAELIKIDVKSIGVGQYQHDMPQKRLTEVLDGVVEDCVNSVGVDLNTASPSLLSKVSGLNAGIAKNIVKYREDNGAFKSRKELKKVSKLGDKAFEQCAGFLRITNGKDILDNTAVHPESYEATEKLLEYFGMTKEDIKNGNVTHLPELVNKKGASKVASDIGIGEPTLNDIVDELQKPGRDIRDSLPAPMLRTDVMSINDLKPGMVLTGTVRNVIDFGAFVDIAVHQDGLVHISQICDEFIKHPSEVLSVGQVVKVKVLDVNLEKNRISLTMKNIEE